MGRPKKTEPVTVRVRTSFDGFRAGELYSAELDATLQGWIDAGWMEVLDGGTDPAGPGSTPEDVPGDVED